MKAPLKLDAPVHEPDDAVSHRPVDPPSADPGLQTFAELSELLSDLTDVALAAPRVAACLRSVFNVGVVTLFRSGSDDVLAITDTAGFEGTVDHSTVCPAALGVAALAVQEHQAIATPDAAADPRIWYTADTAARIGRSLCRAVLAIPLLAQARVVGALVLGDRVGRVFRDAEIRLAQTCAHHIAMAFENARLNANEAARSTRLRTLSKLNKVISSSLDPLDVLPAVGAAARDLVQAETVGFWTADEGSRMLERLAFAGSEPPEATAPGVPVGFGEGAVGWVAEHREILNVPDVSTDPRGFATEHQLSKGLTSLLAVPIIFDNGLLAVLMLWGRTPFELGPDERDILESFVTQAAVAIRNAQLNGELRATLKRLEQSQEQLIHSEKMSALGQLVAGVAHELNNPLTVVLGHSYLLEKEVEDRGRAFVEQMRLSAERAAQIVRNLLDFGRKTSAAQDLIDLDVVIGRAIDLSRHAGVTASVNVVRELQPGLPTIAGDTGQLQQVLLNLITNACQAMTGGNGVLTIRAWSDDGNVRIEFTDTGPGVPPEVRHRIFDPFFTTKPVGTGTGLGLSVAHGIVMAHQGRIWLDDTLQHGARFIIELPIRAARSSTPAVSTSAMPTGRILVVDDDAAVADTLAKLLVRLGCEAVIASSAREARDVLARERFDLIALDVVMPEELGTDLWRSLKETMPDVADRVVFVTGDLTAATPEFLERTGRPVLTKPYTRAALEEFLRQELVKVAQAD